MKRLRPILRPLATMIAVAGCTVSAQSTSGTWTYLNSGNGSGSWATPSNWQGGAIAEGIDAIVDFSTLDITAASTVTLDGIYTIGSLKFGDASTPTHDWVLSGGLGGGLTLDVTSGAASIEVVNRTATINAALSGNDGINVTGAGTLLLNAANSFTGQLNVASGSTLAIGVVGALGASGVGNETIISSGGVLSVATSGGTAISHSELIRVSGTGINNGGAIIGGSGATSTLQNIALTGDTSIGGAVRFNISGGTLDLAGFTLTKVSTNQIAITGGTVTSGDIEITAGNLSFEGGANVKGTGTIGVHTGAVLGLWANTANAQTRQVVMKGGEIRELGSGNANTTFSSPISLQADAVVNVLNKGGTDPATTNLVLNGGISESGGSYSVTKTGPGMLTIAGTNTFTGALNINAGVAILSTGATLAANTINIATGAAIDATLVGGLRIGEGKTLIAGRTVTEGIDVAGNVTVTGGTIEIAGSGPKGTLFLANNLTLDGATVAYDLSTSTTAGLGVNDLISIGARLNLLGTNTIVVRTGGVAPSAGSYTLATYGSSLTGGVDNLVISAPSNVRQTFTADVDTMPGRLLLQVSGSAANLTWVGGGANVWDLKSTANFTDGSVGQTFFNLDTVNFTDSGFNTSIVELAGTLEPAGVVVNAAKDYTFGGSGIISGATSLTKAGSGKLTITGMAHDFTGGVNFNGGTVSIAEINDAGQLSALGMGPLNFAGGTLEYTGPDAATNRTLTLGVGGGTLSVANAGTALTLTSSPISSGGFTKAGDGVLIADYAGAYTGGTTIADGTLRLKNTNAFGTSGTPAVTIANGATLDVAGLQPGTRIALTLSGAGVDGLGALRNSGAGVTNNNIASTFTLAGDASIGTNSRYDFVGGVTVNGGTFTLTKEGAGETWWGPAANATVGNIVVNGGRFGVQSSNNLGSLAHSIIVNAGGQLSTYSTHTNAKPIILNGGKLHNNSAGSVNGAVGTWNGSLTLQAANVLHEVDTFGGPLVLNGKITGPGGLNKISTGGTANALEISHPDNDYTGDTQITRGTLRIVGSGRISPDSALILNGAAATFDGAGTAQTVDGLRGTAGVVTNVALTVNSTGTDDFAGQITGAASSLTKNGPGTLSLSGTGAHTYTGATTVNAGTLLVAGSLSGSATTVNSGGTLGGDGTLGALTLNSGGAIAPGNEGIGTLSASGLVWNGGGTLRFELGEAGASDSLSLSTGVFDKGSGTGFVFDFLGTGAMDSTYTLATFASTDFVVSDFSFVNLGGPGAGSFQMNGNTLQFVTVPEPSAALMLLCGVSGLLGMRRRRGVQP